jgi:SSS family solute:Na+ symporter
MQLLGGIWIIQTLPAVLIGLYTRWFNPWALVIGWAVGIVSGTYMGYLVNFTPTYTLTFFGYSVPGYIALYTLIFNLVLAIILTPALNVLSAKSADQTAAADYYT